MIRFVDFEASSLSADSFPIEVAWVDGDGQGESFLIRPGDQWLANGCPGWSPQSQAIHGINLETLLGEGAPVEHVAARVVEMLAPRSVMAFSDAPEWDGTWMRELLHVGGRRENVRLLDVRQAYGWACRPLLDCLAGLSGKEWERAQERIRNLAGEIVARAEEAEAMRSRNRHRALPDAEGLWWTWRLVREEVGRLSGQAGEVS